MIEPIMFFGIGFLAAGLFGLVLIPLVHNRAVRLTMKRLEAATPLSMAEIQADKDQLRAEFAMSTRRLELSVEQMKSKTTSQLAELGKKTDAINRLKLELGEKTAAIFALEAREKSLRDQLQATENEFSVKIGALREAERALADKQAELSKLSTDLDERSMHSDSQRIEVVALRTQVDALKSRIDEYEKEAREIGDRLDRERKDASDATAELNDERSKVEQLGERVGQLERALIAQTTEAEILGRRVQELEGRMAEQMKVLAQREFEMRPAPRKARHRGKDRSRPARGDRLQRRAASQRNREPEGGARPGRRAAFPRAEGPQRLAGTARRAQARGRADLGRRAR